MLDYVQIISLSVLQGLTEFLPVSSSAHLILLPKIFNWPDQGLAFDVAVHVGTLLAVLVYFRKIIFKLLRDSSAYCLTGEQTEYTRLSFNLILATIPIGLAGLCFKFYFGSALTGMRSAAIIAWSTIIFGLLLGWAAREKTVPIAISPESTPHSLSTKDSLWVGFAQILALIPGASRSGVTLTAGLLRGYTKQQAAEFSFLLSIPVIILAMGTECFSFLKLLLSHWLNNGVNNGMNDGLIGQFLLAVLISGLTGYSVIRIFLNWIERVGVAIFVIYRMFLGLFILYLINF